MTETELMRELARRAGITAAEAGAVLEALGDIARERRRLGERLSPEEFGLTPAEARVAGERLPLDGDAAAPPAPAAPTVASRPYLPTIEEVRELIEAAGRHPLGLRFLLDGQLGAVAVTFGTHAFTVDAARQLLKEEGAAAVPGRP